MSRRGARFDLLLVALVICVVGGAFAIQRGTGGSSAATPPKSPQAAAATFINAYARVLQGDLSPRALPGASARVDSIAAGAGPIPAGSRAGSLTLSALQYRYVRGSTTAQASATARDRRHAYQIDIGLQYAHGQWGVVYLVPPDFSTILARTPRHSSTPPALVHAADQFALAYEAYRSGLARNPPNGLPAIRGQIAAGQDPLASNPPASAPPSIASVAFGPVQGNIVAATAVVQAGAARPSFTFLLARSGSQWKPSSFLQEAP
jgi:hypothetical protein